MSAAQILIAASIAIALLAAIAIFSVAYRGGDKVRHEVGSIDRKAMRRDRARAKAQAPEPEPELVTAGAPAAPPPDPLAVRPEVDEETYDVTRRQFFNRGIGGIFALFLAQFGIASLAFMWPRLKSGGFGSKINAGKLVDLTGALFTNEGKVVPLFVPAAQSYILPFQGASAGSSFEGLPVIAGGVMAVWQRCVHLGCRVPSCDASQGFECPCHGSKYNYHGEYEDGPAPRNLDRFVIEVNDRDELIIDTGTVIETARSSVKTAEYPQGPSCI